MAVPALADPALDGPPLEVVAEVVETTVPPTPTEAPPPPAEPLPEPQSVVTEPLQEAATAAVPTIDAALSKASTALLPSEDAAVVPSVPALPPMSEPPATISRESREPSSPVSVREEVAADAAQSGRASARVSIKMSDDGSKAEPAPAAPRMTMPESVSLHDPSARSVKRETPVTRVSGEARLLPLRGHDLWRSGAWSAPPRTPVALVVAMLLGALVLSPPIAGWLRLRVATARLHPADVRFRLARPG